MEEGELRIDPCHGRPIKQHALLYAWCLDIMYFTRGWGEAGAYVVHPLSEDHETPCQTCALAAFRSPA